MNQTINRFRGRVLFALVTLTAAMAQAQMGVTISTGNPTPVAGGAASRRAVSRSD